MPGSFLRACALSFAATLLLAPASCQFGGGTTTASFDGGPDSSTQSSGADLVIQPGSEDFGTVSIGAQSAPATLAVTNRGGSSTGTLQVALTGGAFAIDSDACTGNLLAPGGSCLVHVHFAPTSAGAQSGALNVSAADATAATVPLEGTGASSSGGGVTLSLTPSTQDFGTVSTGASSSAQTFTLKNTGTADAGAVALALSGQNASDFALGSDECSGKPLAAGASCTAAITFSPASAGAPTATLTATAQGTSATASASLSGTAAPPASLSLSPTTYDFGAVAQGSPTAAQSFVVKNTGGAASPVPTVAIGGPNAADFAIASNGCTAAVPAAGSCSFALTFTPSMASQETATVTVTAGKLPALTAAVQGTGLAPAAVGISPSSQSFGSVAQGAAGPDVAFVVTNGGAVATGSLKVSITGSDAGQFALGTDGCTGQSLTASGGSCTVNVHFAPTASGSLGSVQATLQVGGTPGGTAAATLTGTAVGPATLTVSPSAQAFGAVAQGQSSGDLPITVTNTGGVTTGALTAALGGADAAQFGLGADSCTGQTLAAGASCSVSVHFTPTGLATAQASLTVNASPGGSATANLTGTGVTQAALTAQPSSQTWGPVVQGSVSNDVQFSLTNNGQQTTGGLSVSLGGANPGQFAIVNDSCSGHTLTSQVETCAVTVHFAPTLGTLGTQQATLTISGTPGGSVPVSLVGTAATPLSINPASQGFGVAAFGSPSGSIPFVVTNTSASSIGPLTVALQGANAAQFQLDPSSNCAGQTLKANGTCTVSIVLSPTSGTIGAMAATLLVSAGANTSQQSTLSGTAVQSATLSLPASPQPLGTVVQGQSSGDVPMKVTNTGGVATGTLKAALSAADPTQLAQFGLGTDGCSGTSLAPGGSCTVNVHFAPSAQVTGAQQATLTLSATPGGSPTVTLTGTAVTPAALGIAGSGGFNSIVQGSTSSDTTFTVTNSGGAATGKLAVGITGANPTQFAISSDGCSGQSLAATGGNCAVKLHFAPALSALGVQTATLTVSGTPGGSAPVTLSGTATSALTLSPTSQPFPSAAYGSPSGPLTFTVTNASASTVPGPFTVSLGGANASQYALSTGASACSSTGSLAGGGSATCKVYVSFSPTQGTTSGTQVATLSVSAGASTSASASLSGTAVAPASLGFTSTGSFASIVQGTKGSDVPFVIGNSGGVASGILQAALGGQNASQFGIDSANDTCSGKSLAAGASCTVNVYFAPGATVTGTQLASLTVTGTPGGAPSTTLTATAKAQAALTISASGNTFTSVVQGATSTTTATITVTNTGGVQSGAITMSSLASPWTVTSDGCTKQTLQPNAACSLDVQLAPTLSTSVGNVSATVSASASPGGTTSQATLSGVVAPALTISPTSYGYGPIGYGSSSPTVLFVVTNNSPVSVGPLNTAALLGANPGQFKIVAEKPACSKATLTAVGTAASKCDLYVAFQPTKGTLGAQAAVLDVNLNSFVDVQSQLTGTGATPASLSVDVSSWAVATDVGKAVSKTFTFKNNGGVPTGSLGVTLTGADLTKQDNCQNLDLAAGSTCTVTVTEAATTDESAAGSLIVSDPTFGDSASATFSGGVGQIWSPASYNFGAWNYGATSPSVTFVMTNYGSAAITLTGAFFVSGSSGDQDWFGWANDTCTYKTLGAYGSGTNTCSITTNCTPIANDGTSSSFGWHWGYANSYTGAFWEYCTAP